MKEAEKEASRNILRTWVGGFGKTAPPSEPYILLHEAREMLFPNSRLTAACTYEYADKFLAEFNSQQEAYGEEGLEDQEGHPLC